MLTSPTAHGIRILLVEDNEVNQQVATELLESAGAIVTIANHGRRGRENADGRRRSRRRSTWCSWTCRCRRWMASPPPGFFEHSLGFKDCRSLR